MMNQPIGPGNPGDILYFMRVTLFVTLLCMGYSLSRPMPAGNKERELFLLVTTGADLEGKEWSLPSWQRKASEKAIERYAATQENKWRHWNEAMFERSS